MCDPIKPVAPVKNTRMGNLLVAKAPYRDLSDRVKVVILSWYSM